VSWWTTWRSKPRFAAWWTTRVPETDDHQPRGRGQREPLAAVLAVPAFRALVVDHQDAVHAVLAQMLFRGATADVDDLAQETFLRVSRALPRFEPREPGHLARWIKTIAARVAIDHLRRKRPAVESFDERVHHLGGASADELAQFRRLGARVEAALTELGDEQRSVLVLRQLHGLDYREIADALQIDLGTVKSRLHRARARLRELTFEEKSG
jgi:RNA polymerase sigma-70 factor (ECF subfamily)